MDKATRMALVYLLGSIQAAVQAGLEILQGGDPLPWENTTPAAPIEPPPATGENGECEHPPDARAPLATMGNPDGWWCKNCGFMGGDNAES